MILNLTRKQRAKHPHTAQTAGLPYQELAALRMAGSSSRFRPAEEQFIEQTPWANPQHPSHAHLLQRQASAQQGPRTNSAFSQATQLRRHSDQRGPASGTFSSPTVNGHAFNAQGSGRLSPRHPGSNTSRPQPGASAPFSRHPSSLSPLITRAKVEESSKPNGAQHSPPSSSTSYVDKPREFPQGVRQGQANAEHY